VTVPSTNLDTGNWDADGPLAGWRVERDRDGRILDYVIESTWERKGCFCLLTRVTEYIVLGRYHGPERIGESETYYRGYVHAPGVESLPKGCYGTRLVQCENQGGWFVWDERAFFNGYSHTKTVSEVAHRKTERLADAAAQRREGSYERVLGGRPAETRLARLGDRVRGVLRGSVPRPPLADGVSVLRERSHRAFVEHGRPQDRYPRLERGQQRPRLRRRDDRGRLSGG